MECRKNYILSVGYEIKRLLLVFQYAMVSHARGPIACSFMNYLIASITYDQRRVTQENV